MVVLEPEGTLETVGVGVGDTLIVGTGVLVEVSSDVP